jgi:hypothetical protein
MVKSGVYKILNIINTKVYIAMGKAMNIPGLEYYEED